MARSGSVRRWLEEQRFKTESYDPQQQQDETTSVAWRYARVTWSPERAALAMPDSGVRDVMQKKEDKDADATSPGDGGVDVRVGVDSEDVEKDEILLRTRLPTMSIPVHTVSNNIRHFTSRPNISQKFENEDLVLRRPLDQHLLNVGARLSQRPHSHQQPQSSYLHRELQTLNQPQSLQINFIREGPITRVKLMTSGPNKSPNKHWKTGMYALLTNRALFFFDDIDSLLSMKSGAISGDGFLRDRKVDLRDGARILHDSDRSHSTKRNVLAICSRDGSVAALMQNDEPLSSESWYRDITSVIAKHVTEPAVLSIGNVTNTKSVLHRFFKKRPNKETLMSQGIYKNEPIFGNTLERLYDASDKKMVVPAFVVRCTEILENPPHVLSIGLYRTSGNLSHIQKLRLRVDQEDADALEDLSIASDSDVLAGALKLFFRELQIPLVPYQIYLRLSEACTNTDPEKRFSQSKDTLKKLPEPHLRTLALLCKHLLRITIHERQNQMSAANLGIVWGPSFTWPDEGAGTRALHLCTDINRVVQYLIEESGTLFA